MLKKIGVLGSAVLFALALSAPSAHAETYGPKLATQVHITVLSQKDGTPLKVRFSVTAADGTSPAGELSTSISRGGAARAGRLVAAATSREQHVSGSPVTNVGPVAHVGRYVIAGSFTPDNTARYLPSSSAVNAKVGTGGGGGDNGGSTGGLPNTGGPDLGWLVGGVALLGAGAGAVALSRRRTSAAA